MEADNYLSLPKSSSPKSVYISIGVFILILIIGFISYKILSINNLPSNFANLYEEINSRSQMLFTNCGFDLATLTQANQGNDAETAYQIVASGYQQTLENEKELSTIIQRTTQLKKISITNVSDSMGKNIFKLFDLLDQRNSKLQQLIGSEKVFFKSMKTHYESQAKGNQSQLGDVNTDLSKIQKVFADINNLNFQINALYQEIQKLSGISNPDSTTQPLSLRSTSLTTAPLKGKTQFSLPTIPPTATPVPTASPSATPTIEPTKTASSSATP